MRNALEITGKAFWLLIVGLLWLLPPLDLARAAHTSQTSAPEVLLADAKSLFQQGKFTEADQAARQYLQSHPDSAEGHFLLGHILFREIQAGAVLERQLARQASSPMGGVKMLVPDSSEGKDREEKAKASLAEFTTGAKYRKPAAADLKIVAFDYILLGDYLDADKWLTKMLEWTPDDSDGWYNLGRTKYTENRFAEAISAFQQCVKLDPKNVKAEDNLGLSLAGLGHSEEAAAAYQQAIAWEAQDTVRNPGPYVDFGRLQIELNRLGEAVANLQEAVRIAPKDPSAHELLGQAYVHLEDLPAAQAELEKAIELSPQNPSLHCMLAPVYRRQGLKEKANVEYGRCDAVASGKAAPESSRP